MITNFKIFENINESEVVVGDYILLDLSNYENPFLKDMIKFVENNIGKIVTIQYNTAPYENCISITFDNITEDMEKFFNYDKINNCFVRRFYEYEIILSSNNIEDLKVYLNSKKYNL